MSILTHQSMTNHHASGYFAQLSETVHLWRRRYRARQELLQWSEHDLHDIGISRGDALFEAEKPFWRA